jgi:short-subunit dehydrogenase
MLKRLVLNLLLVVALGFFAQREGSAHTESLVDKTVVITGASSGFGRGVAIQLAKEGANVVLAARRKEVLEELAVECGKNALAVPTDVSKAADVKHLAEAAKARFGHIDVWINDAGVGAIGRFEDIPIEDHERVIQTNLIGTINGSYYAIQEFKKQSHGTLINIASMVGKLPVAYYSSYSASKTGVEGLDATLRAQLVADHEKNIHICTVNPMAASTPFFRNAANYSGHQIIPSPICPPEKVVKVIVKLVYKPKTEVNVGFIAKAGAALHKIAPETAENFAARQIHKDQMVNSPVAANTDGSLHSPQAFGATVSGVVKD